MSKERFLPAFAQLMVLSIVIIAVVSQLIIRKELIGPSLMVLGLIPLVPLKIAGRSVHSVGADIVFGAMDTGIMAVGALIGAGFAGAMGAVVGSVVGDSITDGMAGLFEGRVSEILRAHGIDEARTPLSSSMGKMSGCLLGGGITLTLTWTLLS